MFLLFVVQNHGGNIVNISATLPYKGQALQVHAGSAKAANGNNNIDIFIHSNFAKSTANFFCPTVPRCYDSTLGCGMGPQWGKGQCCGTRANLWNRGLSQTGYGLESRFANWIIIFRNVYMSIKC